MSPDKTQKMSENIGKRVKVAVVVASVLLLVAVWFDEVLQVLKWLEGQQMDLELLKQLPPKVVVSALTLLTAVATFLLHVGRDLDLHNVLDRAIGTRKETHKIIQREMEKAAEGIDKQYVAWMRAKPEEVLKLFYHFVNRQDVLRGLAFTYWEQYFVNLYQFVIFATGFLVSLVFAINRGHWDWIVVFPTLFALLTLGYGLSTHFWLRKKLFDLPVQQIAEVKASSWDELKTQLKARFGGIIV